MMSRAAQQEAIRQWLKAALAHSGMSQAELAREIWDGDRSVPNKILLGKRDVRVEELGLIAQATGYAPFVSIEAFDARPLRPPPGRAKRRLHVQEWREHSEFERSTMAKAVGIDEASYEFLEAHPHKFSIEQAEAVAKRLKIDFDQLWFDPRVSEAQSVPAARQQGLNRKAKAAR